MRDGASRTLRIAACAEDDAVVGVFDDRTLLTVFLFELVYAEGAIVDAFAAVYAFFVVYFWSPRDFASWDAVICFFSRDSPLPLLFNGDVNNNI